jgi:CRISPR associated protein
MVMTLERTTTPAGDAHAPLYLSRLRLRRDPSVEALARLLLPDGDADRRSAEHRLLWSALTDDPDKTRDFLFRREGDRQGAVAAAAGQ